MKTYKRVKKAYSGMNIDGSGMYGSAMTDSSTRIASSMANYKSPRAPRTTVAPNAGGGISGAGIASGVGSAIQGATEIANNIKETKVDEQWLTAQDDDKVAYGAKPNVGKATGKSALSGAAAGAAIGSVFPGVGTVIGGAVGAVVGAAAGFIGSKRNEKKYERSMLQRQKAVNDRRNRNSSLYFNTETFAAGGDLEKADKQTSTEQAVILGGSSHDDGGNPIVDSKTGEKMFETESEELLLTQYQSQCIEKKMADFDRTGDERFLIELGKEVKKIILSQTKDNSGLYGNLPGNRK